MPMRTDHQRVERLLRPRHIAVAGGRYAEEVIRQCRRIGFAGPIWPLHPSRDQMLELPCYASIDALPQPPDATFIGVSRDATVDMVRALAACDSGGAVALASGFAELDDRGRELQDTLVAAAGGMPLVGPNCYGLLNYLDGAALWPDQHGGERCERGVAVISQSGNICINISMQQRSLPLAYLVSVGNQAVLGIADYIDAFARDPRVSAIGVHLEGVADVRELARAVLAARRAGKPLAVLKSGRSRLGASVALSHTSALVGADSLYDTFFRRYGVARVNGLGAFLETLKLLHVHGPLGGARIASMSCSGGEAGLVADQADQLGLRLPAFSPRQTEALRAVLGERVSARNPLDYHTYIWGDETAMADCFTTVLSGQVDAALLVLDYPHAETCDLRDWMTAERALASARERGRTRAIVVSSLPESLPRAARERLLATGIAPLQGLEDALQAVRAAARIGNAWAAAPPPLPLAGSSPAEPSCTLDERVSKKVLSEYGIAVPPGRRVRTAAAAVHAAGELGYPLALKALGVAHKSEHGAVQLGLRDAGAVHRALARMHTLAGEFLLERMVEDVVAELLIGITRDAQFGPTLVLGAGGVMVELLADHVSVLLPTSRAELAAALRRLRIFPSLQGFRGRPAGDVDAVVEAALAIAGYAESHADTLLELDVNPLLVRPRGQGVVAADALIRLAN